MDRESEQSGYDGPPLEDLIRELHDIGGRWHVSDWKHRNDAELRIREIDVVAHVAMTLKAGLIAEDEKASLRVALMAFADSADTLEAIRKAKQLLEEIDRASS